MKKPPVILIAAPTASGKSSLALNLAEKLDGIIVNADSMQVYKELRLITARPSKAEEQRVPHKLYGHISHNHAYSTGHWLRDIGDVLKEFMGNKTIIIAGGTGLYFKALLEGLSPIPDIDEDTRLKWRELAQSNQSQLYKILKNKDPIMAERLEPSDTQRVTRALEVLESTGVSLFDWQQKETKGLLKLEDTYPLYLTTERQILYERIDKRFHQMVDEGALKEVEAFWALNPDPNSNIARAIGVRELGDYLQNKMTLKEAIQKAQTASRRYAKRQLTWLRRNMIAWNEVDAQDLQKNIDIFLRNIQY